jgi:mRNA-degrading endonuclease RelE of RelBE toxin-antitoxin system
MKRPTSSSAVSSMIFLISDSFQASVGKLTADEQRAAKLAAFELQVNPLSPGLQCHRLENIRDKNFWSARASRDIRLIFHRVESSVMLCYVGHHDPAYDWASRRKIETHPVTGAAQIVEIRETVREIQIPLHVPTAFQPSGFLMSAQRTTTCFW